MIGNVVTLESGDDFQFTQDWFGTQAEPVWNNIIPYLMPSTILEIGSYEGRSCCYLIETLGHQLDLEIHCVDTWAGGVEHQSETFDMEGVEARFKHNTDLAIRKVPKTVNLVIHKEASDLCLATLLHQQKRNYFDFIYIDGSHQAADVLCDAVLGFRLLKVRGIMAFDDYLWSEKLPYGKDPLRCPKPAIDAFININFRKLNILNAPLYQLYIRKIAD